MKKVTSYITALFLLFCCIAINQPMQVHAEQTQSAPFAVHASTSLINGTVDIIFTTTDKSSVFIYSEDLNEKQSVYQGSIETTARISGIALNKIYHVDVETEQGDFYTGTLTAYAKPNSTFIGVLFNIDKLERGISSATDLDDERMVMVQAAAEVEKNNDFKTSNKLAGTSITGKLESKTDVDFFQTMFYSEGDAMFVLDNIPTGKDYDLYIFDHNKKQIAVSSSTNSVESVTIKDISLNRLYYIKVVGYKSSFDNANSYTLFVNHIPKQNTTYGHSFETAKVATTLSPVDGEILYSGDSNYFKFTPSENGIYILSTTGTTDTYGYLYDQSKVILTQNDDKPNDIYGNCEIKYTLEANKQYFMQISHYSTGTGAFSLEISKENTAPIPNNNIDNPTVVNVGVDCPASFNTADSQQWFSFTPSDTGSYKIYATGNANTHGDLYDNSKTNSIIENQNVMGTQQFELSNTLIQGNTYYIKVTPLNFSSAQNMFNLHISMLSNPEDPDFSEQWGMLNSSNGLDINILPAWQYAKGNGFKIGVADSGTYINHEDLQSNINYDLSYNFLHDMKDVFPLNEPMHPNSAIAGHGTHVAGIIGAVKNNIGVVGVAPEASIVPLKVVGKRLPDNPVYVGSIAAFVNSVSYARANDIKVINCSFGGLAPFAAEQEAMLNANDILFVIAAGNSNHDLSIIPEYPACYGNDNSLVVAAISENGELAGFSNYGGPTDIAAPGENIYATFPNDTYGFNTGTSMAAPFVTAVASLVWSNNSALDPLSVKNIVTNPNNVTKLNTLTNKVLSGGLLNAFKSVTNDDTEVSARSIMDINNAQRSVFGRDIKASIAHYESIVDDNLKTNQIIVKFADGVDADEVAVKIQSDNSLNKLQKIDYLDLINAYVFECSDVADASTAVNAFNALQTVTYAEINYLRDTQ